MAVEGLTGGPANVAVADAGIAEDFRSAYHQGCADSPSLHGRRDTDAPDGPGSRAEHGREHGIGTGTVQQQGPGDVPRAVARDQAVPVRRGEPAEPAGEGGFLEGQHAGQVVADRPVTVTPVLAARSQAPGGAR